MAKDWQAAAKELENEAAEMRKETRKRINSMAERQGETVGAVLAGTLDGIVGEHHLGSVTLRASDGLAVASLVFEPKDPYMRGVLKAAQTVALFRTGEKIGDFAAEKTGLRDRINKLGSVKKTGTDG